MRLSPSAALRVKAHTGHYPVWVVPNLYQQVDLFEPFVLGRPVLVISHPKIADLYFPLLKETLSQVAASVDLFLVPDGEQHKTLEQATHIWTHCIQEGHYRDVVMIALGGGMIGDLAGFVASSYLRGVNFIQCPTSLLAQVDAAIGGKVAVNHPLGKNMIGAFYAPKSVMIDPTVLHSLSKRDFVAGLAEMIKYGLILDATYFAWLERHALSLQEKPDKWVYAIEQSCTLKAKVVSDDEFEGHQRMILNYGHTIGHALETLLAFQILHGEAVAIGMIIATHLSCKLLGLNERVLNRLVALIKSIGLPCSIPKSISSASIIQALKVDKKHKPLLHWVLLTDIGQPTITTTVDMNIVESVLQCWIAPV